MSGTFCVNTARGCFVFSAFLSVFKLLARPTVIGVTVPGNSRLSLNASKPIEPSNRALTWLSILASISVTKEMEVFFLINFIIVGVQSYKKLFDIQNCELLFIEL